MVGAFNLNRRMVGTIRLIPLGQALTPCEHWLSPEAIAMPAAWEVGRLVLEPSVRGGAELLRRCLFLTLMHLVRTVSIQNIFATCTPLLARLYRRFGFHPVAPSALRTCDADGYVMIHGTVPVVLHALAASERERRLAARALTQPARMTELPLRRAA